MLHCGSRINLYPVERQWLVPKFCILEAARLQDGWDSSLVRLIRPTRHPQSHIRPGFGPEAWAKPFNWLGSDDRAGWHLAGLDVSPQSDHQLACERDDHDTPNPTLLVSDALVIPERQITLRLIPQPQPSHLHGDHARPRVAGLVDSLVVFSVSAVVRCRRQADVAGDLPAVFERAIEDFPREDCRKFCADAVQLDQPTHLFGAGVARWFGSFDEPVAFGFDFPDLLGDHFEPLPFPLDLDLQPRRNRPAIAGLHLVKTLTPFCVRDPKRPDAMRYQKGLDPVQMAGALTHQSLPFTMEPPRILFLGRWRANHPAALRIALHEAYNRPEQALGVDIVCLDMLGAAIDRDTRCIEDVVLDAVVEKHSVQPEPVVACLIAAYRPDPADALVSNLRLQAANKLKQPLRVPARYRMHVDLVAKPRCERGHEPGRAAQLHRQKERILEIFGLCFHGEIRLTVHVHLLCQRIRSAYWSTPACCIGSLVMPPPVKPAAKEPDARG